ncbi:MAG: tail fiber protein [Bacteroidota bacterium]
MEPYLAEIRMFGGNFAPRAWALCDGQLLAINSNQALFSLLGTTYGGDGRTTFGLPAMRGRLAVGYGEGPGLTNRPMGQKSGSPTNTLTTLNLASHSHAAAATGSLAMGPGSATTGTGANSSLASTATAGDIFIDADPNAAVKLKGNPIDVAMTVGQTGNQQPLNNMMPFLAVNYIICVQGIFPSRN